MPRMDNKAVSGEKGSPPQDESKSGDMKIIDIFRMLSERMDSRLKIQDKKFEALQEDIKNTNQRLEELQLWVPQPRLADIGIPDWRSSMDQHLTSLEQDARQPRFAMEVDGPAHTKTRERTEGAATAVQAMHGGSCSADRVDPGLMCSTSFGDDCTRSPAPSCSGENALVANGAVAPNSCIPSLEMRTTTATGGLLSTGETSTPTKVTSNQSPLRLY